jgi:hypothetical protein
VLELRSKLLHTRATDNMGMNMVEPLGGRRPRFGRVMIIAIALLILIPVLWIWFSLSWAYSEGERAGVLQKFSKKGWLCKTYEGELAQYVVGGVAPQIWRFSTRDEDLAKALSQAVGEQIRLHYSEHRFLPTNCFAETPYFAESFQKIDLPLGVLPQASVN